VIAAALSISDPRERPYDQIDRQLPLMPAFKHPESDFITYLTIWNQYHDTLEKLATQSKLRKFCHEHYLSYKRMIEWRDIHHQILEIISGNKKYPARESISELKLIKTWRIKYIEEYSQRISCPDRAEKGKKLLSCC